MNDIYRNNLKNREFVTAESLRWSGGPSECGAAPQNFCSEGATIAYGQGANESNDFELKPTQSKPDSSGCFGVIVGCDLYQEWLLLWWWSHYSSHNAIPVAFVDMGMSEEGALWCKERGEYIKLQEIPYQEPPKLKSWET